MRTRNEIDAFFNELLGLPESELLTLHLNIASLLRGTSYESSMDLLHEAMLRYLDEARQRPPGVDLCPFLFHTARSIVHSERKGNARHPTESIEGDSDDPGKRVRAMDQITRESAPSAEEMTIDLQNRRFALRVLSDMSADFESDAIGRKVLTGWMTGMSPLEMRKEFGLSEKDVKAALMRVDWRIKKWKANNRDAIQAFNNSGEPT